MIITIPNNDFEKEYPTHYAVMLLLNEQLKLIPSQVIFSETDMGGANQVKRNIILSNSILYYPIDWFAFVYAHELAHLKSGIEYGRIASSIFVAFFEKIWWIIFIAVPCTFFFAERYLTLSIIIFLTTIILIPIFAALKKHYVHKSEFSADLIAYNATGIMPDRSGRTELGSDDPKSTSGYPSTAKRKNYVLANGNPIIRQELILIFNEAKIS